MSPNKQIHVTLYQITRVDNNKPVCDNKPFKCTMKMTEKFETIFQRWQKEVQPETPLQEFEFIYFRHQSDEPDTTMAVGGPLKGCITLKGDQTPEQVHMQDNAKIYVKREDLQCNMEEEPQMA